MAHEAQGQVFGAATRAAVLAFQEAHGLDTTGIVDATVSTISTAMKAHVPLLKAAALHFERRSIRDTRKAAALGSEK